MEIEARELRIGNYISSMYGEGAAVIKSIVEEKNWGGYFVVTENNKTSIKMINPIPLTEEWLIKLGFKKDKVDLATYYFGDFEIQLPVYLKYKDAHLNKIKYVHQLQNLYFALREKELTYEN
jgi:hypothetical protein